MSHVFHRLHRIRKVEEQIARVETARREEDRDAHQAEIIQLNARVERSRSLFQDDAATLHHHHAFALHQELKRRNTQAALESANRAVDEARAELRRHSIETRTVELLAEGVDAQAATDARLSEQRELDEVGSQRWLRKAS
jgi:flagellar export protein FliJ